MRCIITKFIRRRYIKDSERKELLQQALTFCSQAFKDILKQHSTDKRNDTELLALIVEIYKAHKKCLKNISQKETVFSALMVDTYKVYIQGKVAQLPENVSIMDLAVKLCQHEINSKNRLEKQGTKLQRLDESNLSLVSMNNSKSLLNVSTGSVNTSQIIPGIPNSALIQKPSTTTASTTPSSSSSSSAHIPGLSRPRGRPPGSKNVNSGASASERAMAAAMSGSTTTTSSKNLLHGMDSGAISAMMALYSNPNALMSSLTQFTDPASLQAFLTEYYKLANLSGMSSLLTGLPMTPPVKPPKQPASKTQASKQQTPQQSYMGSNNISSSSSSFPSATITTTSQSQAKLPQLDIQSMFTSSTPATQTKSTPTYGSVNPTATTIISVGSGELTITPSTSHTSNAGSKSSGAYSQQQSQIPGTSLLKNMQQQHSQPAAKSHRRSHDGKESKKQKHRQQQMHQLTAQYPFPDKPGISVTAVNKPPNLPLDLPKSLSITPSPLDYNKPKSSPSPSPFVSMQVEKPPKPPKQKKQKTQHWPKPSATDLSDYSQQMAMFTQYNEIMNSTKNTGYLSQFEQFLSYPSLSTASGSGKSKNKTQQSPHRQSPLTNLPSGLTIGAVPSMDSSTTKSKKGSISVKQLPMQQSSKSDKSAAKHSSKSSTKLPMFSMADMNPITSSMLNPFAMTQPTAAHSSSTKKSIFPGMSIPTSIPSPTSSMSYQTRFVFKDTTISFSSLMMIFSLNNTANFFDLQSNENTAAEISRTSASFE